MSALETLGQFYAQARLADVPEPALDIMRLCFLDWMIVGRAAKADQVAQAMLQFAHHQRTEGPSALFFGGSADPRRASLVNGTISHALDYDDTHFAHIGHVSTVVIPAALAQGQASGASLEQILRAALLGAEAATRVGVWLGRGHYQIGYHQTATAGAIGAAVAAGAAANLADIRGSLSNVAGFAAGLKAQFGTAMKPVNAGMAAANGVEAVQMAMAGLSGASNSLEAFAQIHHGERDDTAWDALGQRWLFEGVTHKFYPCCHGTHAMIEALRQALPGGPRPDKITVRTHPRWMSVCNKPEVADALEAKFSYRALAALLVQNAGATVDEAALQALFPLSAETRALMGRVEVLAQESLGEEEAHVTLKAEGQHRVATHDLRAPLSFEARLEKLMAKGEGVLAPGQTTQYWEILARADISALSAAIRA